MWSIQSPANNSATDVDSTTAVTDLAVAKTDGLSSAMPGDVVTYTVTVTNAGPSDAVGATLTDTVPALLSGVTWTCAAVNGACASSGTGSLNESINVAVGGTVTFAVTGTVVGSATGTITNTATVAAPAGGNDPNPVNNSATDTTTVTPRSDLSITKTDGNLTDIAGTTVTYTIQVSNAGPSMVAAAPVADVLPAALSNATWSCISTAGSACTALTGTGDISTTVDLLAGGAVTFTVNATIDPGFTGTLSNSATVTMPVGLDPTPANNTAVDTTNVVAVADLGVTKTDGLASEVPGTPASYTIVVTNTGPSDVVDATVTDVMPTSLLNVSWTCSASAGGSCTTSGTGDIADLIDVPTGGSVTYVVTGDVAADASGSLSNSVSVAPSAATTDPDLSNNNATDVDTLVPTADLSVTKTDGAASEVPGTPVAYTIVVSNAGPSDVFGASVTDVLPASLLGASWTCSASGGSVCPASGSNSILASIDLATGGTATFTVTGTVSSSATGSISNTVTVAPPSGVIDPDGSNNSATDVDTLVPTVDLSVTKTDGAASEVPGTPVAYTIVVDNSGPSDIVGANVTDAFPASLLGGSWTCVVVGGSCPAAGSGSINASLDLAAGGTATFTVAGTVSSSATGSITNTVTVTPPAGSTDTNPTNNSASDTDSLDVVADLAITKTDNDTNARPGDLITYEIVATNSGPSAVTGSRCRGHDAGGHRRCQLDLCRRSRRRVPGIRHR